jgi:hypothetical protein
MAASAKRAALQPLLAPLADLCAATITPHSIGASDHVSFEEAGVPRFAFIRDFMETSGGPITPTCIRKQISIKALDARTLPIQSVAEFTSFLQAILKIVTARCLARVEVQC